MTLTRNAQVAAALSRYLSVPQDGSFRALLLRRDLGFHPLSLVWFVIGFEEPGSALFDFEGLEHVSTVGELVDTVAGWLEHYDESERLAEQDERLGKESGTYLAVRPSAAPRRGIG